MKCSSTRFNHWLRLLTGVLLGWLSLGVLAAPLIFAVHPYLSTREIEQRFTPLVQRLSADIGLPITLRVSADYESHIQAVGEGRADIAYIGPAELLITEARYGRRVLLGQVVFSGRLGLSGHLVTRQPVTRPAANTDAALSTVRGQRIAFVDAKSTMGYLVPMAMLKRAGIQERDFQSSKFVGSHENVALGVLAGEFQIGAVKDETFEKYRDRGLYSLFEMPTVPEHLFVASPRVPAEWQGLIQRALLRLADDEAGRKALHAIRPDLTKIAPLDPQDFAPLRKILGLNPKPAGRTP